MKAFFEKAKKFILLHKVCSSIIAVVLVLAIIACVCLPILLKSPLYSNNVKLTRATWVQMLKSNFGLTEYDTEEPFFSDISKNDSFFNVAQALKERNIIDYEGEFEPNAKVTFGEMLSHISKLYGTPYIEKRLDKENVTEADLLEYIRKQTVLSDKYSNSDVLNVNQATEWIDAIHKQYLERTFGNSFSATYKEKVRNMQDEKVYSINGNTLNITTIDNIVAGDILILGENEENPAGIVRKVDTVTKRTNGSYILTVSEPEPDEVVEKLDFEFSQTVTMDSFIPAEGISVVDIEDEDSENITLSIDPAMFNEDSVITLGGTGSSTPEIITVDKEFDQNLNRTFFNKSISFTPSELVFNEDFPGAKNSGSKDDHIADGVFLTNDGKIKSKFDGGCEVELGLKLSNFRLKGSVDYQYIIYSSAFTVDASLDVTPNFSVRGNASYSFPIGGFNYYLGYGFMAEIDLYVVVSIDGEVSVKPTVHFNASVSKDNNSYKIRGSGSTSTDTEVSLNGNANISVGPDITLSWSDFLDFVDVYVYVGVGVSSSYTTNEPKVITASIYLPTLHIGIGENDNTLLSVARELFGYDEKMDLAIIDNNGGIWNCPYTLEKKFQLLKSEPLKWTFDKKTGTLTVSGTSIPDFGMTEELDSNGELIIDIAPWYYGTQEQHIINGEINPVNVEIKKIVVEEGCTYIGKGAFSNLSGCTEIILPSTLTTIAADAFSGCCAKEVVIPDGVTYIGEYAFYDNVIEKLVIPNSVKTIGNCAFQYSNNLKKVTLGDGVNKVGYQAFADCPKLKRVELGNSLKRISYEMFARCGELEEVTISPNTTTKTTDSFLDCPQLSQETRTSINKLNDYHLVSMYSDSVE